MHFLKPDTLISALQRPWAGVVVRVVRKKGRTVLEIQPGVSIAKAGTLVTVLPQGKVEVQAEDGEIVLPERGCFLVTTETIDPFHMIFDGYPPQVTP